MNKFKAFIHDEMKFIIYYLFCMGIISLIFYLYGLPWAEGFLLLAFLSFIWLLFLGVSWLRFKKTTQLKLELAQAKSDYQNLINQTQAQTKRLEDYFVLWVHQIKTPITSIQLMLDNYNPQQMGKIKQELASIETYTGMAISYMKLASKSTDLDFTIVDLDSLIQPLLKRYSIWFIYDHIQLDYQPLEQKVLTDARWTAIMIEQILANAVKYAKGEKIKLFFDPHVHGLVIEDTGIGIREEDLPRIFEQGFSGFNGQYNDKSSGLGLFLVKEISQKLDQKVIIESTLGQGTRVTLYFKYH
ncbi:sensor histidine kinase [Vaginisenegalia massiliensis]|uniref:sensor histidine kinase n=1 Tax=Vaginisenegalia massiliensis TaxID=2058294 RepID=UPI000F521A59|nr:sensor histidine kinase [Vaginisenegalia massiliensis]